jgi:hypothetical protein
MEWFGDRHIHVYEVLKTVDNRVFRSMYKTQNLFIFDEDKREYYVNRKEASN